MQYSGQRFINAPLPKVWSALQDAQTLDSCFAADNMVRQVSDTAFAVAAPINEQVEIEDAQPMSGVTLRGQRGHVRFKLDEETPQLTRLGYTLEAQQGGLEAHIESLLDAFQEKVSGPREIGASGLAGAQAV